MTKHNLQDHLEWLLRSQPTIILPSISTSAESNISSQIAVEEPQSRPAEALDEERDEAERTLRPDFVRPPLPTRVLEEIESEEMARLQSGPRPSKKPHLMSQLPTDDSKSGNLRLNRNTPSRDQRPVEAGEHNQSKISNSCMRLHSKSNRIKPNETIQACRQL